MRSETIRKELFRIRKQKTMTAIAQDLGVTRSLVSQVVARKIPSTRVKLAVAEAINRDPRTVWPELFKPKQS
jgi:transcriptional regulator with XRE-family HTH domain